MSALSFLLLFLHLLYGAVVGICPGYSGPPVPLYFGYMASLDLDSSYITGGTIPAVQLALELINSNSSLLNGYMLSYNGTVYDSGVRLRWIVQIVKKLDKINVMCYRHN